MVMPVCENPCPLLLKPTGEPFDVNECRRALEAGSEKAKIEAMVGLLHAVANGEPCGSLVMHVIRFVMPNQKNKFLKKLVLYFFELVPKVDADGKLLQEMILLCNALRSDLQHPNEYVRGVTLRFVCKLAEPELLEPLVPVVRTCLEHSHPYVRKNAIFAVWSIYERHEQLLPDGPELIEQVLAAESDADCQRNAFLVLAQTEPGRASAYFESIAGRLETLDGALQLAIVGFMLGDVAAGGAGDKAKRSRYVRALSGLVASSAAPNMVKYDACSALMALTAAAATIKAIAACYVEMALREADNNAKLVVLDRLAELQTAHPAVVNEGVLDVLRVLGTADAEIRKRALRIVLAGVSARVAADLVAFLGKELQRCAADEDMSEYRRELLRAVHVCAERFPETAAAALAVYAEALEGGAADGEASADLPGYAKAVLAAHTELRTAGVERLAQALQTVAGAALAHALLWIVAEYAPDACTALAVHAAVHASLRDVIDGRDDDAESETDEQLERDRAHTKTKVLADGTYATDTSQAQRARSGGLARLLVDGHHAVAASVALALAKLVLRFHPADNATRAQAALACTAMLRFGLQSKRCAAPLDPDTYERVLLCIRVLAGGHETAALAGVLRRASEPPGPRAAGAAVVARASAPIVFRLPTAAADTSKALLAAVSEQEDLARAVADSAASSTARMRSALSKVVQLTGFSDAVYAETYVLVRGSDVLLDVLLVNQTGKTLPAVTLDLATAGDLRVVEKPAPLTLPPHGFAAVKAALRVAAAGAALVHGALAYGDVEPRTVVLAPIALDVADFLDPDAHAMDEAAFRRAWPLLEWENKINIGPLRLATGDEAALRDLLLRLLAEGTAGRLACITPGAGLADGGHYLAANMYARSVFGEDVLANICLERAADGPAGPGAITVAGHARLRSRSQGIAVALGDKIAAFFAALK